MMDIVKLISMAQDPDAISLLLQNMGQTSFPARPENNPNSNPAWQAQGQFFGSDMLNLGSEEAARVLLNSLGQTGGFAEKVPMSPQTSAGFAGGSGSGAGAPLTAEEQAFVNGAPSLDELIQGWGIPAKLAAEEDAKFRDIPRTGQADTRGGVARVNQYTSEHLSLIHI